MIRGKIEKENIPEHKRWLWDFRDYEDYKDDKYVYGSKSSFGRKEEATLYTSLSATKGMVTKFKKKNIL